MERDIGGVLEGVLRRDDDTLFDHMKANNLRLSPLCGFKPLSCVVRMEY